MDNTHQPRKRFGQNFLCDQNIIYKIIAAFAPCDSDILLEVGPGLGALTDKIINSNNNLNNKLYLIEIDNDLSDLLISKYKDKIKLYNIDILKFDLNTILAKHSEEKIKIIGNLPYNISTPILFYFFNYIDHIEKMLFMLQLEVVERIIAKPNSKQYGRLSVMTQYFCDTEKLFTINPGSFTPQPKVKSAIVQLKPKIRDLDINPGILSHIVKDAFNQRRKNIHNSLNKHLTTDDFAKLNIDYKLRAENLSVNDFVRITRFIQKLD